MTQSYKQIQKQIEALQRQAEKLRQQEVGGVVARIKEAIDHYGLTAQQLFGGAAGSGTQTAKAAKGNGDRAVKFADDQGNVWSGRGPRPHWLRDALEAGKPLEQFAVAGLPLKSRGTKKRKTRVLYRDQAGHTWSGMGPRPRWLKEAIEAGQTLEELSA